MSSIESFSAEHSSLSYNLKDDGTAKASSMFSRQIFRRRRFYICNQPNLATKSYYTERLLIIRAPRKRLQRKHNHYVNGKDEEGGGGGGETEGMSYLTLYTDWTAAEVQGLLTLSEIIRYDKVRALQLLVSTAANDFHARTPSLFLRHQAILQHCIHVSHKDLRGWPP